MPPITFRTDQATASEIEHHLRACSDSFIPPLSERVALPAYSDKLASQSTTFEAWSANDLVALVAAYLQPSDGSRIAFISSVSVVEPFRSRGIAKQLLQRCHREAVAQGKMRVRLEVSSQQHSAIGLYSHIGYLPISEEQGTTTMDLDLASIS